MSWRRVKRRTTTRCADRYSKPRGAKMSKMRPLLDPRALDSLVEFLLEPSATDGRRVEEVRRRAMELLEGRPLPDDCSILKLSLV